tara:strand:- start:468 stop:899 length:432 start_codon:yes stop_codon:yes gene_type:complete
MDKIPDNIVNKKLYKKAKKIADVTYKRHSAYKSMYIQKVYKEMGGTYKNNKPSGGVSRWNKEKWIQVLPYLIKGEIIPCGSSNKQNKVCRPLKRVNSSTPITLPELLKLHSKEDLIKLARKKNRDMNGRIYFKSLKFYPSIKK